MKAIILKQPGDVTQLLHTELPAPEVNHHEVLVEVKAISINPVDVKTRAGSGAYAKLKDFNPIVLGWDVSGIVINAGKLVTNFKAGDEVFGMVNFPGHGRAYAAYVAVPASQLALKPQNISFEEAAATTLAALTAYQAFEKAGGIQPGNKVLVHAAAGGVGHFAVQLAKHKGAYVIGTSSAANRQMVLNLGGNEHFDYHESNMDEQVNDIDLCLDTIGGENIDRSLKMMKDGGRIVCIPSGKNEHVEAKAAAANKTGFVFMVQSNGQHMAVLANLLTQGIIKPFISRVFDFKDMAEAHNAIESGRTTGKIVVKL